MIVFLAKTALCAVFALSFFSIAGAQGRGTAVKPPVTGPKITQIDIEGLKALLKPKGKPLLINFWATWCDPCREEFPELVKLDTVYKGKIDFLTISLDDVEEINRLVPKFLGQMKAEMPAYLLKTPDESAAIQLVSRDWAGNLPLTILYNSVGEIAYTRGGKIKYETMTAEIDKVLNSTKTETPAQK